MRVSISKIKEMKQKGEKITMLTSYDYTTAKIVDETGIPLILVGDSLGMVVLGYDSTIPVTLEVMLHHTKAVVRGTKNALVVPRPVNLVGLEFKLVSLVVRISCTEIAGNSSISTKAVVPVVRIRVNASTSLKSIRWRLPG